ncbi:stage III sporulation protein AE [Bacillaceae bacterium SIJ1]|uniref:stage III sporulation protein AE n=1 Tax=Litoribacterium kuwaitense TaxID=1398745 RepID=UPI0013EBF527|nr:stage III sporulation protein AE [Litoribacterium kuwaitense]NGP43600.1 stage III sporulation protein AE [Litoribacterium kuwaitense]
MRKSLWSRQSFHIALLFLFIFIPMTVHAEEATMMDETNEMIEQQLDEIELGEIQDFWEELSDKYDHFLPESHRKSLVDIIRSQESLQINELIPGVLRFLFQELIASGQLMGTLVILTVFSMLLQSMQNAFEQKNVAKIGYAVVYMVLILLALNSFHVAMDYANSAISTMIHFLVALIPLLLALMATVGAVGSAALFHPLIIFLVNVSSIFIQSIVLPLLFLSLLLGIVSSMTEHYKVSQLANLFRQIAIGALGVLLAAFLGVISVQGATAAVTDGMLLKTAKFVAGNFVPVVGRLFTDTADLVIGASLILKNTIGIIGLGVLVVIVAFPAMKILVLAFIYRLTAALMQPLGDGPVIECLQIISKCMMFVFASLAIVSLMFFLALTIMITASNIPMMVR